MKGLSPEKLKELLSGPRNKKPAQQGYALIRTENGLERVSLANLEVGGFIGNVGSTRRNRKGRQYRLPNGRRHYAPNWEVEVIAYKVS
jgi:hypothetical protein